MARRSVAGGVARVTPWWKRAVSNTAKRLGAFPLEQTAVATIQSDHDPPLPFPAAGA